MTRSYALRFLSPLISRVEGWRAGVARGAPRPTPRLQPPPRRTQRADFPHCAPPFASRQSLWGLSCVSYSHRLFHRSQPKPFRF